MIYPCGLCPTRLYDKAPTVGDQRQHRLQVKYIADGNCALTEAMGLSLEAYGRGLGRRCKRFACYLDDGAHFDENPRCILYMNLLSLPLIKLLKFFKLSGQCCLLSASGMVKKLFVEDEPNDLKVRSVFYEDD